MIIGNNIVISSTVDKGAVAFIPSRTDTGAIGATVHLRGVNYLCSLHAGNPVIVIKAVKELFNIGLKDAKDIVDFVHTVRNITL